MSLIYSRMILPDGKQCPISLQIEDIIYKYKRDSLFDKLEEYVNSSITIKTFNVNGELIDTQSCKLIKCGKINGVNAIEIE